MCVPFFACPCPFWVLAKCGSCGAPESQSSVVPVGVPGRELFYLSVGVSEGYKERLKGQQGKIKGDPGSSQRGRAPRRWRQARGRDSDRCAAGADLRVSLGRPEWNIGGQGIEVMLPSPRQVCWL